MYELIKIIQQFEGKEGKRQKIIETKHLRIRKNYLNLGFWIVKDSQKRVTINLWIIRLQIG